MSYAPLPGFVAVVRAAKMPARVRASYVYFAVYQLVPDATIVPPSRSHKNVKRIVWEGSPVPASGTTTRSGRVQDERIANELTSRLNAMPLAVRAAEMGGDDAFNAMVNVVLKDITINV